MKLNTKLIHGYQAFDGQTGASSIPIYQASTFAQEDILKNQDYTYTRFGNPTVECLEKAVAKIEKGGKYGVVFSSGMAAISAVLLQFSAGDHLVLCKCIYGGTFTLATEILTRFGIEVTFVDETKEASWEKAIRPNTKAIYMETPSNPLLNITDIQNVVSIAKKNNLLTIMDNTFMTPQFQNPLSLGVDIVIHSATKFLNGHSDVVAGIVITKESTHYECIKAQQKNLGAILSPNDAWLVMRGLKTMGLRLNQSAKTAQKIAEYLNTNKKVKHVYYPGLHTHPQYEIHKKQATSGGAVLSFELNDKQAVETFLAGIHLPIVAVSLGGVESILSYPVRMSHAGVPEKDRLKQGITDGLLRLSCGIEDTEDLLSDIKQALENI